MPLLILSFVPGVPFHLHLPFFPIICLHLSSTGELAHSGFTSSRARANVKKQGVSPEALCNPRPGPGGECPYLSPSILDQNRLKSPCLEMHSGFPKQHVMLPGKRSRGRNATCMQFCCSGAAGPTAQGKSLLKHITVELEQHPGTAQPQAWVSPLSYL